MYGIIAAMQEEMQEIKNIMEQIEEEKIYNLTFIKGRVMGLLKSNMPIEQIIEITELDKQEIEKIKQENRD